MSEVLTKVVVDCSTGESTVIPLSEEELLQRAIDIKENEERRLLQEEEIKKIEELKNSAINKLTQLGLTEDEAKAIIL